VLAIEGVSNSNLAEASHCERNPDSSLNHPENVTASPTQNRAINRLFIVIVVLSSTFGNFFLAVGMNRMPGFRSVSLGIYILRFATNWQIVAGVALLTLWMAAELTMFSWADLSYVLPVTASAYIFNELISKFLLNEQISPARWAGAVLIAGGSMMASFTPVQTAPHGKDEPAR
jgi:hypothetical protein